MSLPHASRARYLRFLEKYLHPPQERANRLPLPAFPPRQRAGVNSKTLGGRLLRKPQACPLADQCSVIRHDRFGRLFPQALQKLIQFLPCRRTRAQG